MKRYVDEVYDDSVVFIDRTVCSIRGCKHSADKDWRIWITVSGKSKKLTFCEKHGIQEYDAERLYEIGG